MPKATIFINEFSDSTIPNAQGCYFVQLEFRQYNYQIPKSIILYNKNLDSFTSIFDFFEMHYHRIIGRIGSRFIFWILFHFSFYLLFCTIRIWAA